MRGPHLQAGEILPKFPSSASAEDMHAFENLLNNAGRGRERGVGWGGGGCKRRGVSEGKCIHYKLID